MAKEILVNERNLPTIFGHIKTFLRNRDLSSITNFGIKKQKRLLALYPKIRCFQRIGSGPKMLMQAVHNDFACVECLIRKNTVNEKYISFRDYNNNEITILLGDKIYFIANDIFVNKKGERFTQVLRTRKIKQ